MYKRVHLKHNSVTNQNYTAQWWMVQCIITPWLPCYAYCNTSQDVYYPIQLGCWQTWTSAKLLLYRITNVMLTGIRISSYSTLWVRTRRWDEAATAYPPYRRFWDELNILSLEAYSWPSDHGMVGHPILGFYRWTVHIYWWWYNKQFHLKESNGFMPTTINWGRVPGRTKTRPSSRAQSAWLRGHCLHDSAKVNGYVWTEQIKA